MGDRFGRLNSDQRKLVTDLLNTLAKLFLGGGFVAPFLGQIAIPAWLAIMAILMGLALHLAALYVAGTERLESDD